MEYTVISEVISNHFSQYELNYNGTKTFFVEVVVISCCEYCAQITIHQMPLVAISSS